MPQKNPMPATDSARDLRNLVHGDVTADFETDLKFVDSNPIAGSSKHLVLMRDTDDEEDSDDELEEDDDDEEYEEDDDEEYEEDDDDPDAEAEYDDEDEEEEEEYEDDDEEDEDDEDDEDEVGSSDPERFILKRAA